MNPILHPECIMVFDPKYIYIYVIPSILYTYPTICQHKIYDLYNLFSIKIPPANVGPAREEVGRKLLPPTRAKSLTVKLSVGW
jgi:hypothetical protein